MTTLVIVAKVLLAVTVAVYAFVAVIVGILRLLAPLFRRCDTNAEADTDKEVTA